MRSLAAWWLTMSSIRGVSSKGSGVSSKGSAPASTATVTGTPIPDPATEGIYLVDHFVSVGSQNDFLASAVSGAGGVVSISASAARYGLAVVTTGTGVAARAGIVTALTAIPGPSAGESQWLRMGRVSIPTISDGVETFTVWLGYTDNLNGSANDGAYFEIDANANANALCVTANATVRTTVNSGVPILAGVEYTFEVMLTNASAVFSINGAVVATIPTNIPGTGVTYGIVMNVRKAAGVAARSFSVDYLEHEVAF